MIFYNLSVISFQNHQKSNRSTDSRSTELLWNFVHANSHEHVDIYFWHNFSIHLSQIPRSKRFSSKNYRRFLTLIDLHLNLTENKIIFFLQLRRIVWWICFGLGAFSALCAYYVYNFDIEKPSIEATFYAIVYRHCIGLLGLYVMAGFLKRYGWFLSDFFSHSFWRIPGKISFSSYIVHNFVLQLVLMDVYQPIVIDGFKFVSQFKFIFMHMLIRVEFAVDNCGCMLVFFDAARTDFFTHYRSAHCEIYRDILG